LTTHSEPYSFTFNQIAILEWIFCLKLKMCVSKNVSKNVSKKYLKVWQKVCKKVWQKKCVKKQKWRFVVRSLQPSCHKSPKICLSLHLYLLFELPLSPQKLNYAFKSWNLIETYFLSSYFENLKSHFVFINTKSLFLSRTQSFSLFFPLLIFLFASSLAIPP